MTTINEYHLLVNPNSGSGKGIKIAHKAKKHFEKQGKKAHLYESQYQGHLTNIILTLAPTLTEAEHRDELIVVIGGDGTISEAINALGDQYASIPLAFIPSGSGNDFSRGISISRNPKKALEQILNASKPKQIDVIVYTNNQTGEKRYAVNNVGLGLDASIIKQVNQSTSKVILNKLGFHSLVYLSAVLSHFIRQKPFPLKVSANGKTESFQRAFLVTVNNHPYFGSGIKISPKASAFSGKLDLIVLERVSGMTFLKLFLLVFTTGKHLEVEDVHYYHGKELRLSALSPVEGQKDGEEIGFEPFDMTLTTTKRLFWFES